MGIKRKKNRGSDKREKRESKGSRSGSRRKSSKGSKKFDYNRSPETVRKRADQSGSQRDSFIKEGFDVFKPHDKQNHVRILPPTWDDAEHFAYDCFINYQVGSDESSYLSLSSMLDEDDPIHEERKRAEEEGDNEYADSLKPTKRPVCWVIDRDSKDQKPMLWPMPWTMDRDIATLMIHKRTGELLPIDDLEEGYDIFFEKSGKGLNTRYQGLEIDRESSPVFDDDDDVEELIEFLEDNPVPDCLQFFDYDHIAKVFSASGAKAKAKSKNSKSKSGRSEDEDDLTWEDVHEMDWDGLCDLVESMELDIEPDEYDDDDELADQICEELGIKKKRGKSKSSKSKSKSKRSRRKSMKDMDDDEDDEDDEDDDEDDDDDDDRYRSRPGRRGGRRR